MKLLVFACLLAACGAPPRSGLSKTPSPDNAAACGTATCAASEICIETDMTGGARPAEGQSASRVDYRCSATPQVSTGDNKCTDVENRRQRCQAFLP